MTLRPNTLVLLFLPVVAFTFGYMFGTIGTVRNEVSQRGTPDSVANRRRDDGPLIFSRKQGIDQDIFSDDLDPPKKYFLDCGGNVASSVQLFRETYPGAKDFIIHSFEIDGRLRPYFASYSSEGSLVEHIPVGVAGENGNMTAYLEGPWYPGKINFNKDMQWGGGSLYAHAEEIHASDGGSRKLSRHVDVPLVDLSQWIQTNTRKTDYVILKLDVEGAEYGILKKMIADKTFDWIDKFYGELHEWMLTGYNKAEKEEIKGRLSSLCVNQISWAGEHKTYGDFEKIHNYRVEADIPGPVGIVNDRCIPKEGRTLVSIVIEVGMNVKAARRLVETIKAYHLPVPLTLFVYGDFVEENPYLVKQWSALYEIGIRSGSPLPEQYWKMQNINILRMSIVSAEVRLREIEIEPAYIFPSGVTQNIMSIATERELGTVSSTLTFPPNQANDTRLTSESYFKYRDVERTPKALKIIHEALEGNGGILSLDSDFPDNYMISVFLLDYLFQTSPHRIVTLRTCVAA